MDDKLLVRVYDVGCGDCILLRVPDTDRHYHFLIDCGNFWGESSEPIKAAVSDVRRMLTEGLPSETAGQLDLLVATHMHWDHLKGFELNAFQEITVKRIWMSLAMDEQHQEATGLRALHAFVDGTVEALQARGLQLGDALYAFLMNSLSTGGAVQILRETLPQACGIEPLYVYRGFEQELSEEQRAIQLFEFKDPSITLKVLAPEKDIDGTYLDQANALLQTLGIPSPVEALSTPAETREQWPANISKYEYQRLRNQLLHAGLGAAAISNHVTNNTSTVLLLEWRGRRLLFPGDAQWGHDQDPEGSWEVMWKNPQVRAELERKPLDFLKVSHHGSVNATPWNSQDPGHPINEILNALLPLPNPGETPAAQAVVSTRVSKVSYAPAVMAELGKRVANAREYPDEPGFLQPQRTDKENEPSITIAFDPAPDWSPGG